MTDIERAKQLLLTPDSHCTCVLCKGDCVYSSEKTGIAPMMDFLDSGADLSGFCAADRIVGRAAAMLFCLGGIREVYAEVMTDGAARILEEHGITCSCRTLTSMIVNRRGDGPCPMEKAVQNISDPVEGYAAIHQELQKLKQK